MKTGLLLLMLLAFFAVACGSSDTYNASASGNRFNDEQESYEQNESLNPEEVGDLSNADLTSDSSEDETLEILEQSEDSSFAGCIFNNATSASTEYQGEYRIELLATAVDILEDIPYFGDRESLSLPAEHALAYAEAIRNAEVDLGDWGLFSFDELYPVFIDVSGDGVPLLLLVDKSGGSDLWGGLTMHQPLLFGYTNGEIQQIAEYIAIGLMLEGDETLLSVGRKSDFGGSYNFYRISNGAAEFVSTKEFVADWSRGEFSIDGVELSSEEYSAALEAIPTSHLIYSWHPGNKTASPMFEEYLLQPFAREQAMQIFLDYAAAILD